MSDSKKYPSDMKDQFIVRLPDGMRDALKAAAAYNSRSMNAEVVHRLMNYFDPLQEPKFVIPTANCCVCGRLIDKREKKDGGDGFGAELTDGRWTCSIECDDKLDDSSVHPDALKKYICERLSQAIYTQNNVDNSVKDIPEWIDLMIEYRIAQRERKKASGR